MSKITDVWMYTSFAGVPEVWVYFEGGARERHEGVPGSLLDKIARAILQDAVDGLCRVLPRISEIGPGWWAEYKQERR